MDKTDFIKQELQQMLLRNEISPHMIEQVEETVRFLNENNIFRYERADCRKRFGDELIDLMAIARKRYWDWRRKNE